MKWIVAQLVESMEEPQLEDGQAGLCCPLAELNGQYGDELLNLIETDAYRAGKQIQQFIFTQHVRALDMEQSARRVHEEDADCDIVFDGQDPLTFVTRFGVIQVPVQQARCRSHGVGFTPLNRMLPQHHGPITTRSVQELSCLFAALSPSYHTGNQLLAIVLQEPKLLSTSKNERIVRAHGEAMRRQENHEAEQVLEAKPVDVPALPLRTSLAPRRSALADEVTEQVHQRLADADLDQPPAGLSKADWKRIVTQSQEAWTQSTDEHPDWFTELGPYLRPGEVALMLDEVVVKGRPKGRRILEFTARMATTQGFWYVSGQGKSFRRKVLAALRRLKMPIERLSVIADGASWIRDFYSTDLTLIALSELILDWYHLHKKCHQLLSMVCHGRKAREEVEAQLRPLLWQGDVEAACQLLAAKRSQTRNEEKLDELIGYLSKHQSEIPNYDRRRTDCQFNGAGMVEKENDLLVSRRQKRRGMQWVSKGADVICALRTLWFNGQWDAYWNTGLTCLCAPAG
ncbi:MAG: hypothetical protein GTO63_06925 [Anaerolineae bacterium]|nr:hypothetical protein [Anaerolineae bacterium]NIN94672.1 hypothetical protein [Anaerolineae bacterium]NIQ77737.1 hypothetical protein [Anaerolineae bacterium]